jgi:regulator of sigma E protease
MVIISAGVIMNVIFGLACFTAAYLHGVEETPATVGHIEGGGAAWRSGMRSGDQITMIDGRQNPTFNDLKPIVMSSSKDEKVPISWEHNGAPMTTTVTPIRDEGQRFPQIGVGPVSRLTLQSGNKRKVRATFPGTPAAAAEPKFEPGDRIIEMSDPNNPAALTEVGSFGDYHRRMVLLADKDITFKVKRKDSDETATITVKPAYRHDLGMRMRMGEVVALRAGGGAEGKVIARSEGAPPTRGDRITAVMLPPKQNGERVWYVAGSVDWSKDVFKLPNVDPKQVKVEPLDPLLLPRQLNAWAVAEGRTEKFPVGVVVLRPAHPTDVPTPLTLDFDPSYRFDRETAVQANSPLPLSGLGLAYWVEAVVDEVTSGGPAAAAGVQVNDVITAVRFKLPDENGGLKDGPWNDDIKAHQWASADGLYQLNAPEVDIKVKRGDETKDIALKGVPATAWPLDDRGLIFQVETNIQKASGVGDAIRLGAQRTVRFIKIVYMNFYAMLTGRVSVKTMSGPLSIANISYKLAGEDFWQFLLFLGVLSVNLAVVNFLPIPVLDGGHMVFLILEKILGRPVPERLFAIAMYTGLFLILSLMVFVLWRDVDRLFLGGS